MNVRLWILVLSAIGWLPCTVLGADAPDFDLLLSLYRQFGMPLPPKAARIVEYRHPGTAVVNGVEQPPSRHLAYLLKEEMNSLTLLVGPIRKQMGKDEIAWKFMSPKDLNPKGIEMESLGLSSFEVNTRFALALQLHAQGERRLAAAFFEGCLAQDYGHRFSLFYQPAGLSPEKAVAHLAWAWLANRLLEADSSRAVLLQTAKNVFQIAPELKDERSKAFIASL